MTDTSENTCPDDIVVDAPAAKRTKTESYAAQFRPLASKPHYVLNLLKPGNKRQYTQIPQTDKARTTRILCSPDGEYADGSVVIPGLVVASRVALSGPDYARMDMPDDFQSNNYAAVPISFDKSRVGDVPGWSQLADDVAAAQGALECGLEMCIEEAVVPMIRQLKAKVDKAKGRKAKDEMLESIVGLPKDMVETMIETIEGKTDAEAAQAFLANPLRKYLIKGCGLSRETEDGAARIARVKGKIYPDKEGNMPWDSESKFKSHILHIVAEEPVAEEPMREGGKWGGYSSTALRSGDVVLLKARLECVLCNGICFGLKLHNSELIKLTAGASRGGAFSMISSSNAPKFD